MKRKILFLLICNYFLTEASCSLESKYYENLITQRLKEAPSYRFPENNEEFRSGIESEQTLDFGSYDFVIVGAGSAGSVLATRLSEVDDFSVLLLEAGGEEDDFNQIMALCSILQMSKRNWGYLSTKQNKSCLGFKDHRCNVPTGKSIGGSSAINVMVYTRGNPKDYDKWEEMGNPGWSYKHVLPYFIKSENSQVVSDPGYHGKAGFWNVEYVQPSSPLRPIFFEANKELNILSGDFNGRSQHKVSDLPFNIKRGKRHSTGTAFLDNARVRRNLKVLTKVLATKVIIDPKSKVAQGVEFVTKSKKFKVVAKKEVIVSAGAINSAQLLMLSGIGPRNHLKELGIEVLVDLPVGLNLLEHPMTSFLAFRTNYTVQTKNLSELVEMYLKDSGPLTRAWGLSGVGFFYNKNKVPKIEYILVSQGELRIPPTRNMNNTMLQQFTRLNSSTDLVITLLLLHPKSRGRISLKSKDPLDFPNVDLNMLDKKEDVNDFIEGIEFILKLMNTKPFKAINATILDSPFCSEFQKLSKDYWSCMIRTLALAAVHVAGSTRMGPDPKTSVVDSDLKVHELQRLRVVDAGVMPATISGHTNAPTVMVAEKIADAIKREYGHE